MADQGMAYSDQYRIVGLPSLKSQCMCSRDQFIPSSLEKSLFWILECAHGRKVVRSLKPDMRLFDVPRDGGTWLNAR